MLAVRSAVGIEALVWLTDVAGLTRGRKRCRLMRWSAQALSRRLSLSTTDERHLSKRGVLLAGGAHQEEHDGTVRLHHRLHGRDCGTPDLWRRSSVSEAVHEVNCAWLSR